MSRESEAVAQSGFSIIDSRQSHALRNHDRWGLERSIQGLGPESTDAFGNGPLHLTCHPLQPEQVSLDFVSHVLSWAPRLDRPNGAGWTPLSLAILFLPATVVGLLAQRGTCEVPSSFQDALLQAANYERPDVTRILLDSGVCPEIGYRNEALSFAGRFDRHAGYLMQLDGLAGRHPALDREVARNERTEAQVLERLAGSADRPTLRAVTLNPNTSTQILFELAPRFPRPFFRNPAFDWLMLEDPDRIFELGKGVIRNILRLRSCPDSMIQWAITHGSDSEKLAVIRRENVSVEALRAIAANSQGRVRALAIAKDADASPESLGSVVGVDETADRMIAAHPNCSTALLERLSEAEDQDVVRLVLANPLTSEAARRRLSGGGRVFHVLK